MGFMQKAVLKVMLILLVLLLNRQDALVLAAGNQPAIQTVHFSGYDWDVRPAEVGGPGPNHWDTHNVRVDKWGALHLKITQQAGIWRCAEVYTKRAFGFGRYQFQVTGPIDRMDRSVVFGLFNYPQPEIGPDGTNEIDIEYSHWGNPAYPLGNYTVYPAHSGLPPGSKTFPITPGTPNTTQSFVWQSGSVTFQSTAGQEKPAGQGFGLWKYAPADSEQYVPQKPLPVHINLWLFAGTPPRGRQEIEVVVKKFTFTPASAVSASVAASGSGTEL